MKLPPFTVFVPLAQITWIKHGESKNGTQYISFLLVSGNNALRCEIFDDPEDHKLFQKSTELVKGRYYSVQGVLVNITGNTKNGDTYITNVMKVKLIQEVNIPKTNKPDLDYDISGFGM